MLKLAQFNRLVADFGDVAEFVTVYVKEAHPKDGWAITGADKFNIYTHQTLDERIDAARQLLGAGLNSPLVVDAMDNAALLAYTAVPEAIYVIDVSGKVAFRDLGPYYDIEKARKWLEEYVNKTE